MTDQINPNLMKIRI